MIHENMYRIFSRTARSFVFPYLSVRSNEEHIVRWEIYLQTKIKGQPRNQTRIFVQFNPAIMTGLLAVFYSVTNNDFGIF